MILPAVTSSSVDQQSSGESSMMSGSETLSADDSLRVEQWLNTHTDFLQDYLARNATPAMVDSLLSRAVVAGSPPVFGSASGNSASGSSDLSAAIPAPSTSSNSRASSGANTPVRKISAQEFEKRGQMLKPMVTTVDGVPSFLGVSESSSPPSTSRTPRRRRSELKSLDSCDLMYELVLDICNDLDLTSLGHKILQNVGLLLSADRCSLFLVERRRNWSPADGGDERCLVSKLFDVSAHSTVNDCNAEEIKVAWGCGIVGHVAMTGSSLNIPDAYEDERFNAEIDQKTGYKTRSILCMPIKDSNGEVLGVAQAINKTSLRDEPFTEHDEKIFQSYLAFCGIGIHNAQMYERLMLENRRNQLLLDLAWAIFEEQTNVANLIHKIMVHTQSLLQCERCQVMLVDETGKSQFSHVFDLQASDVSNDETCHRDRNHESRFPVNIGITGYVATTGETLNIKDAYEDDRFDKSVDETSGDEFRTRSILCMPIKNTQHQVVGVAQLVNKLDGTPFNKNDENLFEAFAIFCGMGINNTHMYEKVVKAMARQSVALEVMSYHASASLEEVQRIKKLPIPEVHSYGLIDYKFSDFTLDDDNTLRATARMFIDLDLINKFHIPYEVFLRWMLSVKKNYRAVAYHNWRHAFNVTQTMFTMVANSGKLKGALDDVERLALIVGALSHDLDHRGTNNQFQIKTMSPLAQLYSTSVMERHHFDHCIMILSTKGNDILANLSKDEYQRVIELLEEAILATDLALYFKHREKFFLLVNTETLNWSDPEHCELVRSMMMTACDLSAITKPWDVQKKVAELIASEFFEQGDIEKNELNIKPIDMMDREKQSELPRMQIGFIDAVCMPVYQVFARLGEEFEPLLIGCQENRRNWLALMEGRTVSEENDEKHSRKNKDDEKTSDNKDGRIETNDET